jgi:hypothetical protein
MRETRTGWTTLALVAMVSVLSADESLAAGAARNSSDEAPRTKAARISLDATHQPSRCPTDGRKPGRTRE